MVLSVSPNSISGSSAYNRYLLKALKGQYSSHTPSHHFIHISPNTANLCLENQPLVPQGRRHTTVKHHITEPEDTGYLLTVEEGIGIPFPKRLGNEFQAGKQGSYALS